MKFQSIGAPCAAGVSCVGGLMFFGPPVARATRLQLGRWSPRGHNGCAYPLSESNDAPYPPPPPAPNASVCINTGRRITIGGCV